MNRRGFLAALLAVPAAALLGLRRPRGRLIADPDLLDWTPITSPDYSVKPFVDWQLEEIARTLRIPVQLLGEDGSSTFGAWEGTEAELADLKREWIERTHGRPTDVGPSGKVPPLLNC